MLNDLSSILITEEELQAKVRELGARLAEEYRGLNPVLVCILKGAVVFYSDLIRAMPIPLTLDFMAVSSYGNGTRSTGEVEIRKDLSHSVDGRHVIIVEDIIDSGRTLSYLSYVLASRGAKSVKICTLLDKPDRRDPKVSITVDYSCFIIPDEFVVGYGLDYAEKYRNLPMVGVLKREIYEKK